MTRTTVPDSCAIVALLTDDGCTGDWVAASIAGTTLAAPALARFEAANIPRRQQLRGDLEPVEATLAHSDLLALPLHLWPYEPLAEPAWELRHNVTICDAAYLALAEPLEASLVRLDGRLGRATGLRCRVIAPPDNAD